MVLDAPIVGVTVYPAQARIARRGSLTLPAGRQTLSVEGLPSTLVAESVRVSGRGASARVTGVDVARRHHPAAPDATIEELEKRQRDLEDQRQRVADHDAALATEAAFLEELARRGGGRVARALAAGEADADRVVTFGQTVRRQLESVSSGRRDLARDRQEIQREIDAVQAELDDRHHQRSTERREIDIAVETEADTSIELEVSYIVGDAGWRPVYDARIEGHTVSLDWHGLVTQSTGEDWPAVAMALSTARPAMQTTIPELDPWYVDVWRAYPLPKMRTMSFGAAPAGAPPPEAEAAEETRGLAVAAVADVALAAPLEAPADQGTTSTSYRLPRPVAVPSDGSPHKATIARVDLDAKLDYVAVPKLAAEAYLRATVTNTSAHTLLPGAVSVFHGDEFVGTTAIEPVPPGGEVELHLGVDDRLKVERELVRRETGKAMLSGNRRTAVTYAITVESGLAEPTRVAVIDQFPVSKHEDVKVRDTDAKPAPAERTDLDVVTWEFELGAGAKQQLTLAFTLEHPKNERLIGWGD